MRITPVAFCLVLLGASGLALAAPAGDEEFTFDLTALPGGPTLFLACSEHDGKLLDDCGFLTLWQQSNIAPRLQTRPVAFGGVPIERDTLLLG
jgi:hypothetical protein